MLGFLLPDGSYFEADVQIVADAVEVPRRPDPDSEFVNGAWKARVLSLDEVKERERGAVNAAAAVRLERLDGATRRLLLAIANGKGAGDAKFDNNKARVLKYDDTINARDAALAAIDAAATKTAARAVLPAVVWP